MRIEAEGCVLRPAGEADVLRDEHAIDSAVLHGINVFKSSGDSRWTNSWEQWDLLPLP